MAILYPMTTETTTETTTTCEVITRENVTRLGYDMWIHHATNKMTNGEPERYRVGSVKTWKRQPGRIEVTLRYGVHAGYRLYDYMIDSGMWHFGNGREHNHDA